MVFFKQTVLTSTLLGLFCSSCFATTAQSETAPHWDLSSTDITAENCAEIDIDWAFYLKHTSTETLFISAQAPSHYQFENPLVGTLFSFTLLDAQTNEVHLQTPIALTLETKNLEETTGLRTDGLEKMIGESISIETSAQNKGMQTSSTAWYILNSQSDPLPQTLSLSATAINEASDGGSSAVALKIENSAFSHHGQFNLLAEEESVNKSLSEAAAIKLTNSQISLESTGNSHLTGDILFDDIGGEPNSLQLSLTHPDDRWSGRVYSFYDTQAIQPMTLTLANGATWSTTMTSSLETFHWKKGGVLDISEATEPVDIGLRANSDVDNTHKTYVQTGAVLRIKVTDKDIGTGGVGNRYKLQIEDITAIDQNAEILVQIIDEREKTANQTEGLDIGLVRFNSVAGGIHFAADQYRYETALGTYETVAQFGSSTDLGTVINAIGTERIGLSTLSQNRVDYLSAEIIAHEMLLTHTASMLPARFNDAFGQPQRGLWADFSIAETELEFNDGEREQTLKSQTLTVGYDHALELKVLEEGFAGLWAAFGQNDIDFSQGSADADQWAIGLYAGGYSSDHRKMLIHAFYGQAKGDFTSLAYAADDRAATPMTFDTQSDVYGAGLYIGFPLIEPGSQNYAIEPYIAGDTYWIKPKHSQNGEVGFESETIHQSVARIGIQSAYQFEQNDNRIALKGDLFWAHRFAGTHELIGTESGLRETFQTEDLQESWAEAGLGIQWSIKDQLNLTISVRGALSKEVTPKYRMTLQAQYFFD